VKRTGIVFVVATSLVWLALSSTASATTHTVRPDGLGDFDTIQAAITAVSNADVIELTDGTFEGDGNRDVDFLGKAITVRSQSGDPTLCTIDCGGSELDSHRGFLFQSWEATDSVLQDVTITNGHIHNANLMGGGAIYINNASPMISGCVITGNKTTTVNYQVEGGGIAIWGLGSTPVIENCTISENTCGIGGPNIGSGGGIFCKDAAPTITDCTIEDNATRNNGGGVCFRQSAVVMLDCVFKRNEASEGGGGSFNGNFIVERCAFVANVADVVGGGARATDGLFLSCTFIGNSAGLHGGGAWTDQQNTTFSKTIIAFSTHGEGVFGAMDAGRDMVFLCCNVFDNEGGEYGGLIPDQTGTDGNISEDPLFCDVYVDDFTLCENSPCLSGGNPCTVQIGAYGQGCGECEAPVEPATWGTIKGRYR